MTNSIKQSSEKSRFEAALQAVRMGRQSLLSYFGKLEKIESKDKLGLVSEADRETEKLMKEYLFKSFPEVEFLGEETSYLQGQSVYEPASKTGRWILDPLDGTTNYVHGLPIFCISLAYEINGEVEIGIIDVPLLNQLFVARKGHGAFCNEKKMSVSKCSEIENAFLTTGFVNEDESVLREQLNIFNHFVWKAQAIRRPGAAAYDLAMVASGVFDLYWEKNIKPWDVAAGLLLVEEAGGICTNYTGEKYNPFLKSIVASNLNLNSKFLRELKTVI